MKNINELAAEFANGMTLEQMRAIQTIAPTTTFVRSPEAEQAEAEYWRKVFSVPAKKTQFVLPREHGQQMTYNDAKSKVWEIFKYRAQQIATIERRPFKWEFSDDDKRIMANLVKYFINDPTGDFNPAKGLFIFGRNGTGKTETMQAFARFTLENNLDKTFILSAMSGEYTRYKSDNEYDPITANTRHDRCFDEFGRFTGAVKKYGDDLDINEAIIEARYERFRRYGQLTHFIANMTPHEAEAAFSPMIFDRLRSMCTSIELKGNSKRS